MIQKPKISIVTPSFNQGEFIEETICSILDQAYPNLEYIIMDGGSTDSTIEILKKYDSHITYWESKNDRGQSHAINKGLSRISGDIFNWINSDDIITDGTFKKIAELFQDPNTHCVAGNIELFGSSNEIIDTRIVKGTLQETLNDVSIKQPSTYYSIEAINKMGLLNESLHYIMDYEWFHRFLLCFDTINIVETDHVFSRFRLHDASKTGSDIDAFERHKDDFWESAYKNTDRFNGPNSELYNDIRIQKKIANFFYKRCVITYGERDFEAFSRYEKLVNVEHLMQNEKTELKRMKFRKTVLPRFIFK